MKALVIMAALLGQSATPTVRQAVNYDGMVLVVEGTRLPNGNILWSQTNPFNARSLAAARAVAAKHERPSTARPGPRNYGVDSARLGTGREFYTAASPEARLFVAETRSDSADRGRLHVTIIGSASDREAVVADLKGDPAFDGLRDHLMVQDYDPGEWPVDPSLGFPATGKPAIIVQAAAGPSDPSGGRVLYRAADYAGGPARLAEAIRRADPNYRPALDPGPDSAAGRGRAYGVYAAAAALVAAAVLLPRKEG